MADYFDTSNTVQHILGTEDDDVFIIDGLSTDYQWGPTEDNEGIVVWRGDQYDILHGIENIRFNDATVHHSSFLNSHYFYVTPLQEENGFEYHDTVGVNENLTGTTKAGDTFIIDGNASDYNWGYANDHRGVVVWKDDEYSVLHDIEYIQFNDARIHCVGGWGQMFDILPGDSTDLAPVTGEDFSQTVDMQPITIDLLANDHDPEGGKLTLVSVHGIDIGMNAINPDGTITFTPLSLGYHFFNYFVEDENGQRSEGYISVDVVLSGEGFATDDSENAALNQTSPIYVLFNDHFPSLEYESISSHTQPKHGSVTLVDDSWFQYTPFTDFVGTDSFSYSVVTGDGTVLSAEVAVNVTSENGFVTATKFLDREGLIDHVQGTESVRDVFVIDGNSADYGWGPSEDLEGIVVWKGDEYAVLHDVEYIQFNDLVVKHVGWDEFELRPTNIVGTDEDDILLGTVGNDVIEGLKGADQFALTLGDDTIKDLLFTEGDSISFEQILGPDVDRSNIDDYVTVEQSGSDAVINIEYSGVSCSTTIAGLDLGEIDSASQLVDLGYFQF